MREAAFPELVEAPLIRERTWKVNQFEFATSVFGMSSNSPAVITISTSVILLKRVTESSFVF